MALGRQISPLQIPHWEDLEPEARSAIERLEDLWPSLARIAPERLLGAFDWMDGRSTHALPSEPRLEHRLSTEFMRRIRPASIQLRSRDEFEIATALRRRFEVCSATGSPDFLSLVEAMGRLLSPPAPRRCGLISSEPDVRGDRVIYPEPDAIEPKFAELQHLVALNGAERPGFAAVVLLNGICNLHPLVDGNGRVARICFNLAMSARGRSYLPLHELAQLSRGSYLLGLRMAQYRGQWAAITTLLVDFTEVAIERASDAFKGQEG